MRRDWTEYDVDYLENNIGQVKINSIAKHLNRSVGGVIIKMKRLGIGHTKNFSDGITRTELARLLGVDSNTVGWWTQKHGLPFHSRVTRHSRRYYFIDPTDFWEWAYQNSERVDFSKIERNSIVPEPEWVREHRMKKQKPIGNYYIKWTEKEEKELLALKSEGKSVDFIAQKLKRTPNSIYRKYARMARKD